MIALTSKDKSIGIIMSRVCGLCGRWYTYSGMNINKAEKQPFFCIIAGPTGVGKTDFAEQLARAVNGEIINADLGQFYAPLSIGTAKPDWKSSDIPQHLFDVVTEPSLFNSAAFAQQARAKIADITARGKVPLVVGGSGFYYQSLLWPQGDAPTAELPGEYEATWEKLNEIDPQRASAIHKNDAYRITRALALWHAQGKLPSSLLPTYAPAGRFIVIHVTRDRENLYARINERVLSMLSGGWIEETRELSDEWKAFLRKKIIGYDTVLDYLDGAVSHNTLVEKIQKTTRNYAKRQVTFFSSVKRRLQAVNAGDAAYEIDLTLSSVDLYLKRFTTTILENL